MSTHDLGTAGSARRRAAGLAAALLLALSLPLAAGAGERGPLSVRQAAPAIAGQSLRLHVAPIQAGAHSRYQFMVFGGGELLGKASLPARGGTLRVPTRGLAAGWHRLTVRSATLATEVDVRLLPGATLPVAAVLLLLLIFALSRTAGSAAVDESHSETGNGPS
ncbi:MAG TPA: hypothetical protein PLQ31_10285 [Thermoanaerobaculia bacterium]|nr:hypothetical protein [Thermoanaerobaculia bacterium]